MATDTGAEENVNEIVSPLPVGRRFAGTLLMLAGTLGLQGQAALVLILSERFSILEIFCFRYMSAAIIIGIAAIFLRPSLGSLNTKQYLQVGGVAATNMTFVLLTFVSYTFISVNDSTALRLLAPFFAATLARVFLSERFSRIVALACLLSFVGVLFVTRPPFLFGAATTARAIGCTIALGSAFAYGSMYVVLRSLAKIDPLVVLGGPTLIGAALCAALYVGIFVARQQMPEYLALDAMLIVGLGVVSTFSQLCWSLATKYEKAAICSMLSVTEIVWAFLIQALFRNGFHLLSLLGATLIGIAVVMVGFQKLSATSRQLPKISTVETTMSELTKQDDRPFSL